LASWLRSNASQSSNPPAKMSCSVDESVYEDGKYTPYDQSGTMCIHGTEADLLLQFPAQCPSLLGHTVKRLHGDPRVYQ
jgi:hypothetical protein